MKTAKFSMLIAIGLLLSYCTNPSQATDTTVPPHIIALDSMSQIQADMLLIDNYIRLVSPEDKRARQDSTILYIHRLWKKYSITQAKYDSSLSFYKNNVPLMDSLYKLSVTRLNELKYKQEEDNK